MTESIKSGERQSNVDRSQKAANKDLLDSKINFKMKLKVNKNPNANANTNKTFYRNKKSTMNEANIKMSLDKYTEKIDNL